MPDAQLISGTEVEYRGVRLSLRVAFASGVPMLNAQFAFMVTVVATTPVLPEDVDAAQPGAEIVHVKGGAPASAIVTVMSILTVVTALTGTEGTKKMPAIIPAPNHSIALLGIRCPIRLSL